MKNLRTSMAVGALAFPLLLWARPTTWNSMHPPAPKAGFTQLQPRQEHSPAPQATSASAPPQTLVVPPMDQINQMQKLFDSPVGKYVMKLVSNPAFISGVDDLIHHPQRYGFVLGEIFLIISVFLLRLWRGAKAESIWGRIWVSFWTFGLFVVMSTVVLPIFLFGTAYTGVIAALIEAAKAQ